MTRSATTPVPTLWDLATIVLEEVEKICKEEGMAVALAREVLIHIIHWDVKNMEVDLCAPDDVLQVGRDTAEEEGFQTRLGG
jgi:hypothetical protein